MNLYRFRLDSRITLAHAVAVGHAGRPAVLDVRPDRGRHGPAAADY